MALEMDQYRWILMEGLNLYNILWNNNSTSQNLSNLDEGTYSVLVTDFNGCTVSASALINEPDDILVSYTIEDLVCANSSSGSIVTQASGGTGSLNYLGQMVKLTKT